MSAAIYSFVQKAFTSPIYFFGVFFLLFSISYGTLTYLPLIGIAPVSLLTNILFLGVVAGILQLVGYYYYLTDEHIDPNPVTWFMFAYGTLILALLEWDAEATLAELILPTVCGALAIVVSVKCWKLARAKNPHKWWPEDWWPEDIWDRVSFASDILITIGYIAAWGLATLAILTATEKEWAVLAFLFLSNLSTFPAFYPILHTTFTNPEREHWIPWAIWAVAYAILGIVTYIAHDGFWSALMFYPVSNALLHAAVAVLAVRPTVLKS